MSIFVAPRLTWSLQELCPGRRMSLVAIRKDLAERLLSAQRPRRPRQSGMPGTHPTSRCSVAPLMAGKGATIRAQRSQARWVNSAETRRFLDEMNRRGRPMAVIRRRFADCPDRQPMVTYLDHV